jgi:hypothetical protein
MIEPHQPPSLHVFFARHLPDRWLVVSYLLLAAVPFVGATRAWAHEDDPVLTRIAEVRELSPKKLVRNPPVRLRGMVTYHDPAWSLLFIQDESAGIFVLRGERDTPPRRRFSG